MEDLAAIADIEGAWRPLVGVDRTRAEYYLGVVSRGIRDRWRDVDERIAAGTIERGRVKDVVVQLVLPRIGPRPIPGARSWSQTTGPFGQQVTLEAGGELFDLADWMVEVFEGRPDVRVGPVFAFPPSGRYEHVFIWPEEGI
ncbi:Gp19/Gp15/Gp42 family protein [Sinomonas sp. ASV322]|uniref:Gp19/Gp15/Gp42 family protein n=1 Tax=Sinomonas sp. ASV322 TaxID=3041920 RepID=UPI0027DB4342|nr:Gp19/Gp15/Gp42 family protein [Sinomonas sp. ASV322]MDQ4502179.1 Gp19/Gp15/Gp42 family protein [Sinomonas sp. ASV322]